MKELKIKIETLSPTHLGSGEGWGSTIDSDIIYDEFGLPYFPSRRLKGLLRESAVEVLEMFRSSMIDDYKEFSLSDIFGAPGANQTAKVIFNDLYMEEYEKTVEWLKWSFQNFYEFFTPQKVIDSLTEIRQQTAIDNDGTSKDGSLRTIRVLKRGITFTGSIFVDDLESEKLLALACRNLKRVGSLRNRGLGKVSCTLWDNDIDLTERYVKELLHI